MKILILLSILLLSACSVQSTSPVDGKVYTTQEVMNMVGNPDYSKFLKNKEPCFWVFTQGWRELDASITYKIPSQITCKGDTF